MILLLSVICIGVLTYLMRASFLAPDMRSALPAGLERAMRFIPPAVLMALVVPDLIGHSGTLDLSPGNARLLAGLVAFLLAWRTRRVAPTLVGGMLTLWLLSFVFVRWHP